MLLPANVLLYPQDTCGLDALLCALQEAFAKKRQPITDAVKAYSEQHGVGELRRIIDVGCSTGMSTRWLAHQFPQADVTGGGVGEGGLCRGKSFMPSSGFNVDHIDELRCACRPGSLAILPGCC
jgi:trans-aconitate methyltransferase